MSISAASWKKAASVAARAAAIAFAGVASFPGGFDILRTGLDPSWSWAVSSLGLHGFGSKVAFTYGPLGFLLHPLPIGRHLAAAAALRLVSQLVLVGAAGLLAVRASVLQVVFFAVLLALAAGAGLDLDGRLLIAGAACAGLSLRHRSKAGLLCLGLVSGGLLFTKTTLEMAALAIFAAAALLWRRASLAALALHGAAAGALGLFFFSSPAELFGWLQASLRIAGGYSINMSFIGTSYIGWGIALTLGWMLAVAVLFRAGSGAAPVALLCAGSIFLFFKQGFVREDLHVLAFYSMLLGCAALLPLFATGTRDCLLVSAICLIFVAGVAAIGRRSQVLPPGWMAHAMDPRRGLLQLDQSLHPERTKRELLAATAYAPDLLPPPLAAKLRGATVGVIPWELNLCAANGLRCSWNPTLQTYAAYTVELDRMTAEHFEGPDAPELVLVDRLIEFDGRWVQFDAPLFWRSLVANYEPDGTPPLLAPLVLRKKPPGARPEPRLLGVARGRTGEWLEIPRSRELVLAGLGLQLNLRGRLASLLLRVPTVWLDVEYESGRSRRIRISPETAQDGLMIGEAPASLAELVAFFHGARMDAVRRVRLSGSAMKYLKPEFEVRWSAVPPPLPRAFPRTALQPRPDRPRLTIGEVNGAPEGRLVELRSDGVLELEGWARGPNGGLACGMLLDVDGREALPLLYGLERRSVPGRAPSADGLHDGFEGAIPASALGPGHHELRLRVLSGDCAGDYQSAEIIRLNVSP